MYNLFMEFSSGTRISNGVCEKSILEAVIKNCYYIPIQVATTIFNDRLDCAFSEVV